MLTIIKPSAKREHCIHKQVIEGDGIRARGNPRSVLSHVEIEQNFHSLSSRRHRN